MKHLYIPESFCMEKLFPNEIKFRDKYNYVLHKIYEERILNKENKDKQFINLKAEYLSNIIGRWQYQKVLDNLINANVILTDNHYIPNQKAKGYKLTAEYENEKHKSVLLKDKGIYGRIERHKANQFKNNAEVYNFLKDNLFKINIDHGKALKFINQNFAEDSHKWNCYKLSIDKIANITNEAFYTVDRSGRFHSNLTNLSKDLRKFLRYDTKHLVNIDISNSQPFLFNILIKKYFENCIFEGKLNNNVFSLYDCHFKDVKLYENLTSEGIFFEYLMKEMNLVEISRADFKQTVYKNIFYGKLSENYIYNEMKIFTKLFPTVTNIIKYYKKEDYKYLPVTLQKAESDIMIHKICNRIYTEKPGLFINTIHDSILTTPDNVKYVSSVILDEFQNEFNLKPKLKIEQY